MRVLVVDDSPVMRKIVIRAMRQAELGNHTVLEASDGNEGMEVASTEGPDLILSDWNMPNQNGLEFLTGLRSQGIETPFVFVTSENTGSMQRQATEAGASGFITKPFTKDDFREALGDFFR